MCVPWGLTGNGDAPSENDRKKSLAKEPPAHLVAGVRAEGELEFGDGRLRAERQQRVVDLRVDGARRRENVQGPLQKNKKVFRVLDSLCGLIDFLSCGLSRSCGGHLR